MGPNSFVFTHVFVKKCPAESMPPPVGNPGSAPVGTEYGIYSTL